MLIKLVSLLKSLAQMEEFGIITYMLVPAQLELSPLLQAASLCHIVPQGKFTIL